MTLPALSDFSTALVIQTATVFFMSLMAIYPKKGSRSKPAPSAHTGVVGTTLTIAASPDLTNLNSDYKDLPVLLSIFSNQTLNSEAKLERKVDLSACHSSTAVELARVYGLNEFSIQKVPSSRKNPTVHHDESIWVDIRREHSCQTAKKSGMIRRPS